MNLVYAKRALETGAASLPIRAGRRNPVRAGWKGLAEFTTDVVLCMLFFWLFKHFLGITKLDQITSTATLRSVDVEEAGVIRNALGLLEVVRDNGDGVPGF